MAEMTNITFEQQLLKKKSSIDQTVQQETDKACRECEDQKFHAQMRKADGLRALDAQSYNEEIDLKQRMSEKSKQEDKDINDTITDQFRTWIILSAKADRLLYILARLLAVIAGFYLFAIIMGIKEYLLLVLQVPLFFYLISGPGMRRLNLELLSKRVVYQSARAQAKLMEAVAEKAADEYAANLQSLAEKLIAAKSEVIARTDRECAELERKRDARCKELGCWQRDQYAELDRLRKDRCAQLDRQRKAHADGVAAYCQSVIHSEYIRPMAEHLTLSFRKAVDNASRDSTVKYVDVIFGYTVNCDCVTVQDSRGGDQPLLSYVFAKENAPTLGSPEQCEGLAQALAKRVVLGMKAAYPSPTMKVALRHTDAIVSLRFTDNNPNYGKSAGAQ